MTERKLKIGNAGGNGEGGTAREQISKNLLASSRHISLRRCSFYIFAVCDLSLHYQSYPQLSQVANKVIPICFTLKCKLLLLQI